MSEFLPAIPIGIVLAFTIGPVFFTVLETSISKGIKAAIFVDIGVVLSDVMFFIIAFFSTNSLLNSIEENTDSWYFLGGVLLVAYAGVSLIKIIQEKNNPENKEGALIENSPNLLKMVVKGFLLNIINVVVLFYWVGIILYFGPQLEMNESKIYLFFIIIISTYFTIDLGKIYLAQQLKKKLTDIVIKTIKIVVNSFIVICGLFLIFKGIV
ncbi:LysE family transporter [Flavobacteriaceae bacterium]|jgi:threonine/homoserine/homoserine lactone efflux protein|nr:lysine transporter LysE [Flavobacteriaceae bacterium]MDC0210298.1 LysE family transporter [Flavobacteriaceae bacterium]|tara:strand:- start:69 stop:701 length:633 start_codon:yes stop_codon:yes gene_type:complete